MPPAPRGHNELQDIVRSRSLSQELLGRLLLIVSCWCLVVEAAGCRLFGCWLLGLLVAGVVLGDFWGSEAALGLFWAVLGRSWRPMRNRDGIEPFLGKNCSLPFALYIHIYIYIYIYIYTCIYSIRMTFLYFRLAFFHFRTAFVAFSKRFSFNCV